jgi:hypothetical protein
MIARRLRLPKPRGGRAQLLAWPPRLSTRRAQLLARGRISLGILGADLLGDPLDLAIFHSSTCTCRCSAPCAAGNDSLYGAQAKKHTLLCHHGKCHLNPSRTSFVFIILTCCTNFNFTKTNSSSFEH